MNHLPAVKKALARPMAIVLSAVMLLSSIAPALAHESAAAPGGRVPAAPFLQRGPTDPAELEAFLDEFFAREMDNRHLAGAAVSVVKDGELFFAKGYGDADIQKGTPVDPEQTMFYIGSNGKVFTWTAVMQLVEQGKLDLEADVNTYLDFRVPDNYPQPITLRHLMTHTSGFEERWLDSLISDDSELMPVRDWLVSKMPARVRPPGECAGYTNYNAMLAGYIVARVSGQPYEQYIQEHILDPLGMAHSTAQAPTPPDLRPNLSVGYAYGDGAFQVFPQYRGQPAGFASGAHQATVTDMARFMIALLEGGRYRDEEIGEARILQEGTARQMFTTLYTPDPRLLGTAYGLFDVSDNGQRTLGHQGYFPPMQSLLLLLPDQRLGLFVVFNTINVGDLTTQHSGFQRAFFDHYYPAPAVEAIQPPADFAERADHFVGSYRESSRPLTTFQKVAGAFGAWTLTVSDPGDGTLLVNREGVERRFVEVEPLYFRQVDGPFSMLFREDANGRITHLFLDLVPQYGHVRLNWYETAGFNMPLLLVCALFFLSVIPVGVIRAIRNRRPRADGRQPSRGERLAGWILLGLSVVSLLILVGMVPASSPPTELHGVQPVAKVVLTLGLVSAVLTVGAVVGTVLAWKNGYWGVGLRVFYTLVSAAAIAFVWFLNFWNLLGWRF